MATNKFTLPRRALLGGAPALAALSACAPEMPERMPEEATMRPAGHDAGPGKPVGFDNPVVDWIDLASRLGGAQETLWPRTNTVALTMRAMHDTLNAIEPRYQRWLPRTPSEPSGAGASPLVAVSAAAHTILVSRAPRAEPDALLAACVAREPSGSARAAAIALGTAVGTATLARAGATPPERRRYAVSDREGVWRSTSPRGDNTYFYLDPPFLFPDRSTLYGPPPPSLSSARYREVVEEVRRIGGTDSTVRTAEQAEAARFWVPQLLHRNLMIVLLSRLAAQPPRGGLWDTARMVSILATANADADVFAYGAKANFSFWRPVTAINLGSPGITPDPQWRPLLTTPYHPDHPSGHSVDITVGTLIIAGLLGDAPLRYQALDREGHPTRDFSSLAAVRRECSDSRVWCGAHFRTACEEGERIGGAVAARALTQVPPAA
ncbi:vanadium-dependent haloperoxidase [Roseomonas populi]|uniref:Vanadium-dependent haloperoxidase n=1 Tax=Roseomonas populi TaxID=3121582 RepID=A0ABT1X5D9_9PROT|nr:vanadium-dependent haloperoxidase [Roseomonas pecuniae]MCR0983321.1 vanadium-dependent haloperoxidase [Roseomonas pecuniae]